MGVLKDIELYLASADRLNDDGVPSASIALLEDPSGPHIQSHVITKGNENTDTLYQACSISKAITALGVAKLIDQGRLSYETKVVDHVDEAIWKDIVDPKTAHLMELVTVGLLVSHRSGLSVHGFAGYAEEKPTYAQLFAGRPPANTPRMKFLSFPGTQFSYSGGGFTLLQILLEKITGIPFADFMRTEVLEPLGMSRSRYGDLPADEHNFAIPHATAYMPGTPLGPGYHRFIELAAAGLWTTPSDLLRAMSAIQHSLYSTDSSSPNTTFLTRQTADHMLARVHPNNASNAMSFGWFVDDTFFAHAGYNEPGFSCYVLGGHGYAAPLPSSAMKSPGRISIAVMTNSALGVETFRRLVAAVMCFKAVPLYDTLPGFGAKMGEIIPFAAPEGVFIHTQWREWVGHWTEESKVSSKKRVAPGASPGFAGDGEWEIFDDGGLPYVAFDGVVKPHRLWGGAVPWAPASGAAHQLCLVVDGLEMALRLCHRESDGEKIIQLLQKEVTTLRRV